MNNIQEQTARLLADIQTLAYEINCTTEHAVFANFSGHVNLFRVYVTKSKEEYPTRIFDCETYFPPHDRHWQSAEGSLETLEHIKTELTKYLLPVNIFEMESDGEVMTDGH